MESKDKLIFIDIETTGTDPKRHGITQIGGEIVIDKETVDTFDLRPALFNYDEIDAQALSHSKTTLEELEHRPLGPRDAHAMLTEILGKYIDNFDKKDKFTFIAYNAKFDWDFLQEFFLKSGDDYFGSWFWFPPICVAVLVMDRIRHMRHVLPDMKLGTLANALKVDVDQDKLHDACYDIHLTRKIYEIVHYKPKPKTKQS